MEKVTLDSNLSDPWLLQNLKSIYAAILRIKSEIGIMHIQLDRISNMEATIVNTEVNILKRIDELVRAEQPRIAFTIGPVSNIATFK